ncbi:MAG: sulfite exporter TauE/SafE family protein [Chloroflexota bacterium]
MNKIIVVYLVIAAAAFLTGLSKGGLGGALGSLVTPLLALIVPATVAIGLSLPILLVGDVCALYAHWGGWDRRIIITMLPSTIIGVIIGALVIGNLSPVTLQHGLGIVALLYTLYKVWERRSANAKTVTLPPWQTHMLGTVTGLASTVANAGGPSFTIYLLSLRVVPSVFVGTSVLYFALLNAIKIPAYASAHILQPDMFLVVAWSIPLIPLGVWSGILLDRHLDMKTFETLILVLLAVTGVILLLK